MGIKKFIALLTLVAIVGCNRVPAGNVGIKVYLLGTSKGVDQEVLGPGRYWIGYNEELYVFPTFSITDTWVETQAVPFQTMEGLSVAAGVGITFHISPDKVPLVFQKYRRGIDEISDLYLRNLVRDGLVKAASIRGIETVYGKGKTELLEEVEKLVKAEVGPLGIEVENLYWTGSLTLPPAVVESINTKISASQIAQQREVEVLTAKAQAQISIEKARGEADSRLMVAKAEAEALKIRGAALKENQDLVALNAVEKWDGKLPQYILGDQMSSLIQLPKQEAKEK